MEGPITQLLQKIAGVLLLIAPAALTYFVTTKLHWPLWVRLLLAGVVTAVLLMGSLVFLMGAISRWNYPVRITGKVVDSSGRAVPNYPVTLFTKIALCSYVYSHVVTSDAQGLFTYETTEEGNGIDYWFRGHPGKELTMGFGFPEDRGSMHVASFSKRGVGDQRTCSIESGMPSRGAETAKQTGAPTISGRIESWVRKGGLVSVEIRR
jgi:hypothetical protein